jgi:hypothetical protein
MMLIVQESLETIAIYNRNRIIAQATGILFTLQMLFQLYEILFSVNNFSLSGPFLFIQSVSNGEIKSISGLYCKHITLVMVIIKIMPQFRASL